MKPAFIKIAKTIANTLLIVVITLLLFECCYRFSIIDFYHSHWALLNKLTNEESQETDLLVFGDSFSANTDGYVHQLRKLFPNKKIMNAAVPGIGIKQVNLFAAKRIQQTKPKAILYQVYVGNDLLDIRNLSNWQELSFTRNLYWSASDIFLSLRYLNQQLLILRKDTNQIPSGLHKPFALNDYDKRSLLFTRADATYLYKTVAISHDFLMRYQHWKEELTAFIAKIPIGTPLTIVFIPHCAQVNSFYFHHQLALGNQITDTTTFFQEQYPFIHQAMTDFKNYPNVTFLNPLTTLRRFDYSNHRLYYENDPHFNANGHQTFANYLGETLLTP